MILDKEKFKNYHCSQYKCEDDPEGIETLSLGEVIEAVNNMKKTADINNKDIYKVPFFIEIGRNKYCVESYSSSFGSLGMTCAFSTIVEGEYNSLVHYVAPDKRPEEGEYWNSRGIGYDLSGFVVSKLSGERLLRMVKLVLETDEPKSWLDYREQEPCWIQFKFQKEEFDLEKLQSLATANNNIITIDILKQSKI